MAFLALSSTDCDAGSPLTETLMQLIRTNFDDHESRLLAAFAFGNNSILDDFLTQHGTGGVSTSTWDIGNSAGENPVVTSEHHVRLTAPGGGADFSIIAAQRSKMQINLTEEYVAVLQMRVKKFAGTNEDFFMGFQDAALTPIHGSVGDQSDMIGFFRDGAGAFWKFRTANTAGGGGATEVATIGTSTSWGVLRLTVTCSATAGNRQAKVESGTTEANLTEISGSPFTVASTGDDLPDAVDLRPFFGVAFTAATALDLGIDYVLAYTIGRPLAA